MSAEVVANSKTVTGTLLSGTTLTMDTTADAGTAATLVVNGTTDDIINNGEKTAVAFTVGGLDADVTTGGSAGVTFTSSGGGAGQKTLARGRKGVVEGKRGGFGGGRSLEKKKNDEGGGT